MNAKISIVVPVYNVAPYLRDCLDSVLAQTEPSWECICVDDGSTDGSGTICDEYAAADPRFHVTHQRNRGLSAARNAALDWMDRNSSSEYVTFLDSDDWFAPNALEEMLRGAAMGDGIAAFPFQKVDAEARPSGEIPDIRWQALSADDLWTSKSIIGSTAWGKIFPRQLFSDIRFPVGKLHEDEWTTHRLIFQTERAALSNVPLYFYRQRPGSITAESWTAKRLRDALDALMDQAGFFDDIGRPALKARCCRRIFRLSCASLNEMEKSGRHRGAECCRRALRFCLRNRKDRRILSIDHPVYRRAHPIRARFRKAFPRLDKLLCRVFRTFRQH